MLSWCYNDHISSTATVPLAQWIRAIGFYPIGRPFKSVTGRQTFRIASAIHNLMEIDQNYPVNDQKARVAELVDAADSNPHSVFQYGDSVG